MSRSKIVFFVTLAVAATQLSVAGGVPETVPEKLILELDAIEVECPKQIVREAVKQIAPPPALSCGMWTDGFDNFRESWDLLTARLQLVAVNAWQLESEGITRTYSHPILGAIGVVYYDTGLFVLFHKK